MSEITESSEPRGGSNPRVEKACLNLASSVFAPGVQSGPEAAAQRFR